MVDEPAPYDDTQILRLVDDWREGDFIDSMDRAELSRHFGGGSLDPDEKQFGMVGSTNFLMGYRYLNKAYAEHYGIYSRGRGFIEIRVKEALSPERRRYVEHHANEIINRVVKRSKRLRYPYSSTCGDAVLYGTPFLWRWDEYDWCPRYAGKPLMPRDAPADIHDEKFQLWAFRGKMTVGEILRQLKRAEKSKEPGRWNTKALRELLKSAFAQKKPETNSGTFYVIDDKDAEQIEYDAQSNARLGQVLAGSVPVYYFFDKRTDKKGEIDCYIVNRMGEQATSSISEQTASLRITRAKEGKHGVPFPSDRMLFKQEGRFKRIEDCLFPFLLDCRIGGEANMHRILGLGKLNYDLDYKINELINMGLAGVEDDFSPLYEAGDTTSIEMLEQYMQRGLRRNGIVPAGIRPVDRGTRTKNYAQLFGFTNLFSEQQGLNSAAYAGSQATQRGQRELEVEALERQADNARQVNARMTAWLESGDGLVESMVATLLDTSLLPIDKGYPEHKAIKEALAEKGIAMEELDKDLIEARMQRLPGGGDQSLAMARANSKMERLALYDPESQREIIREWTLANDDSYERALELVPEAPNRDPEQVQAANLQNAVALSSGIPMPPGPGDLVAIHLPIHLQAVQGMLAVGALDVQQARGAMALLEHAQVDAQLLAAVDEDGARQILQGIQQMAGQVQQLMQVQQPGSPEMIRAQQQQERLQLEAHKQQFKEQQFAVSQDFRERNRASEKAIRMNQEARADQQFRTNAFQRQEEIDLKRSKLALEAVTAGSDDSGESSS